MQSTLSEEEIGLSLQTQLMETPTRKKGRKGKPEQALKLRLKEAVPTSTGWTVRSASAPNRIKSMSIIASNLKLDQMGKRQRSPGIVLQSRRRSQLGPLHTYSHLSARRSNASDHSAIAILASSASQSNLGKDGDTSQALEERQARSLSPTRNMPSSLGSPTRSSPSSPKIKLLRMEEEKRTASDSITQRGCELLWNGQHEPAIQEFGKAVKLTAENGKAWFHRALAYIGVRDYRSAIQDCTKAIELDFGNAGAFSTRGVARAQTLDFDGAFKDFEAALKLDPEDVSTWHSLGALKYFTGNPNGTIEDCSKALQLTPADGLAYVNRAAAKILVGHFKSAIKDCNAAVYVNPDDSIAYGHRGQAKHEVRDFHGAVADLDKCLQLAPNDLIAYILRGRTKERLGELESAREDLTTALGLEPDHVAALAYRSHVSARLGDQVSSVQDFEKAVRLDPTLPKPMPADQEEDDVVAGNQSPSSKQSRKSSAFKRGSTGQAEDPTEQREVLKPEEAAKSEDEPEPQEATKEQDATEQEKTERGSSEAVIADLPRRQSRSPVDSQASAAVAALERRKWAIIARRDSLRGSLLVKEATPNSPASVALQPSSGMRHCQKSVLRGVPPQLIETQRAKGKAKPASAKSESPSASVLLSILRNSTTNLQAGLIEPQESAPSGARPSILAIAESSVSTERSPDSPALNSTRASLQASPTQSGKSQSSPARSSQVAILPDELDVSLDLPLEIDMPKSTTDDSKAGGRSRPLSAAASRVKASGPSSGSKAPARVKASGPSSDSKASAPPKATARVKPSGPSSDSKASARLKASGPSSDSKASAPPKASAPSPGSKASAPLKASGASSGSRAASRPSAIKRHATILSESDSS